MEKIVEIQNLSFSYGEKEIFKNLSLTISYGTISTIIGPIGSGKSTLARILIGLEPTHDYIKVDGLYLNPKNTLEIQEKIGFAFENPEMDFVANSVLEELSFPLQNKKYEKDEILKEVQKVSSLFQLDNLLSRNPYQLSGGEKQILQLAVALIKKPKMLILDDALIMIDPVTKKEIWKILKQYNREENLTIIHFSSDTEEILEGDQAILLADGKVIASKKIRSLLQCEKEFTIHHLTLPFIADLSNKLQYYKVISNIQINQEKLVEMLWK